MISIDEATEAREQGRRSQWRWIVVVAFVLVFVFIAIWAHEARGTHIVDTPQTLFYPTGPSGNATINATGGEDLAGKPGTHFAFVISFVSFGKQTIHVHSITLGSSTGGPTVTVGLDAVHQPLTYPKAATVAVWKSAPRWNGVIPPNGVVAVMVLLTVPSCPSSHEPLVIDQATVHGSVLALPQTSIVSFRGSGISLRTIGQGCQ